MGGSSKSYSIFQSVKRVKFGGVEITRLFFLTFFRMTGLAEMKKTSNKNTEELPKNNYITTTYRDSYLYRYYIYIYIHIQIHTKPEKALTNQTIHIQPYKSIYQKHKNQPTNQPTEFLGLTLFFKPSRPFLPFFAEKKVISLTENRGKVPVSYPTPVSASTAGEVPNGGGGGWVA